ncbi:non-functional pseudokinase ZED1-like [Prunus yedoensis var. nudiflora]|uniref:Non-functional pseudokinase ZED1-like n=1 Tax=Prunus yedoensis var. nudiflora TaxID=2094558 RepID=A0A314ZRX7_PRUYE|nr:non-functional pseudokinase ZED1-like [Prunus yedoensis var. nudiflora]
MSITIPPDQLYVQENFATWTSGYTDPTYIKSRQSSEKIDVYSFGVLLLVFLMRRKSTYWNEEENVETIADPKILEEVEGDGQAQQQLKDFLALALLCIQDESEARPDMIDVAKELLMVLDSSKNPAFIFPNDKIEDFTEKEVNELMQAGAISVGLGPHRLRVETATVALPATLMLWSDSQKACDT